MSDKVFLKDYENTITEICIKNDGSKKTCNESNKKIENSKNILGGPKKYIFKVEVPGSQKFKEKEKSQNNFHFQTENNINNYPVGNINIFSENENLSLDLFQDYHLNIQDGDNELKKEFEALEDSNSDIFLNLGSNNPSFKKSFILNNNNNLNNRTENNVINHSFSLNKDDSDKFTTKTIIIGKGLI